MLGCILLCLVAVACADNLGYNYQPGSHYGSGNSITPGSELIVGGNHGGFGIGNFGQGSLGNLAGNIAGLGVVNNDGNHIVSSDAPSYDASVILEKQFHTFSAPEDEFDDGNAVQKIAGSVKKSLRIIFIKGPENNGIEEALLAFAKNAAEQKTAVYVLSKSADAGELVNKFNAASKNNNNKPEVHFVKYRTAEEAANAQKAIKNQYDSLGGTSQSYNGVVAPVLNFAPIGTPPAAPPGNAYLPSSIFRS